MVTELEELAEVLVKFAGDLVKVAVAVLTSKVGWASENSSTFHRHTPIV
jgi:hypothetical protein